MSSENRHQELQERLSRLDRYYNERVRAAVTMEEISRLYAEWMEKAAKIERELDGLA